MTLNDELAQLNVQHEAEHLHRHMEELNARIARLAIALHVPITTEAEVQHVIQSFAPTPVSQERRAGIERRSPARLATTVERRTNMQRSELRGLLVMRYDAERKLVQLVGAKHSQAFISDVSHSLERHGFRPGTGSALVPPKD